MSNLRISYLNISPYSRHSPSLQLKTELRKLSSSVERPKSSKAPYAEQGATTRGKTPIHNAEMMDRRYSPFTAERKGDQGYAIYQIAKQSKSKEKPNSAKATKTRDIQVKKSLKSGSRTSDKINEKLAIYQYLQNKSSKRSEESKILHPSLQHTPSRQGSKSHFQEEKELSREKKVPEASILQHRQLIEALEEMRRSKSKSGNYSSNPTNIAFVQKSSQKPSQSSQGKVLQINNFSPNVIKVSKEQEYQKRGSEPKKGEVYKNMQIQVEPQETGKQPKMRGSVKPESHSQQQQVVTTKKHRRGLSSGQNPIYLEQQFAMQQLAMQQFAFEQERAEKIRQHQQHLLQQQQQQQYQQHHQQQQQMEQYVMKDPQQEEDEFYEEFFHMDKMTFGFEKLIISQKLNQPQFFTPNITPTHSKQTSHTRTRSIEEPNSLMPTKSSTRWTTKKSSMGDDNHFVGNSGNGHAGGRDKFNIIEQMSDLDRTDEREEMRRYYKAKGLI